MRKIELLVPASSLEVLKIAVVFGADAVKITDIHKKQGKESERTAVKQIQQNPCHKSVIHPRLFSIDETEGKGQNQKQVR